MGTRDHGPLSDAERGRLDELRQLGLDRLNADDLGEFLRLARLALPEAITHYYDMDPQGDVIPLYRGAVDIKPYAGRPGAAVDAEVGMDLQPWPRVRMLTEGPPEGSPLDFLDMNYPSPELPPMLTVPRPPTTMSASYDTEWIVPPRGLEVGERPRIQRVTFGVLNFTSTTGGYVRSGETRWPGRFGAEAVPWRVVLDGRPNSRDDHPFESKAPPYTCTHLGSLERTDGRTFSAKSAMTTLECLSWALWFCRGSAASVYLPVGFDAYNEAVWSQWAAPHVDPLPDRQFQWFDEAYGAQQFAEFFPRFFSTWSNARWRQALQLAVRYYTDAAAMGTMERNILLAHGALETLAYTYLVRVKNVVAPDAFTHPVSRHIRALLRSLKISTAIPRRFAGLRAVRASKPWDGPTAIAWLRNDVVHPARRHVYGRRYVLWVQGWKLAVRYLELAVLAVVGYDGVSRDLLSEDTMTGAVRPVPWARRP